MNKVPHSGFETQRKHHQKSKIGVSAAPQKDLGPPKIVKSSKCRRRTTLWKRHLSKTYTGQISETESEHFWHSNPINSDDTIIN